MRVSIVIRTKNEEAFLHENLEAIYSQDVSEFDVIVVDSGSTDSTLEIVRKFNSIKLIQIRSEEFTYGRALNIGTAESNRDIVVFVSAHAIPANNQWLCNLIRHFSDPRVAGVYGRQLPHANAYPPVKRQYLNRYNSEPRIHASPSDHFFSNANSAIRRKLWKQLPFDEEIPYCEDQMWARSVLALGYRIIYEPEAQVYHSHNESLGRVYQRSWDQERGFLKIDPARHVTLLTFYHMWWQKVVRDFKFIINKKEDKRWLLIVPVYRFFDAYGYLRPYLPRALWMPFHRRIRRLAERLMRREKRAIHGR